jgi:osmotically-inducible protein OsmY
LTRSGYLPLRQISCELRERTLLLRGSVPSYYLKQMAQSIAAEVEGIEEVRNYIEVGDRQVEAGLFSDGP